MPRYALRSLDWWRHGPKLRYSFDFNDDVRWKSSYQFQLHLYDEEPSGDSSGIEIGTPDEEHFFHTGRTGVEWQISDQVAAEVGVRFRQKDDRFEDFESYNDYQGELEITWAPTPSLRFEASQKVSHRDFEERPKEFGTGGTLQYDRYRTSFLTRYELSKYVAVYGVYGFDKRVSNRVGSASYRSYDQHTVSAGITVAY